MSPALYQLSYTGMVLSRQGPTQFGVLIQSTTGA
jgi:hypothetical protein